MLPLLYLGEELKKRGGLQEGRSPEVVDHQGHYVVFDEAPHACSRTIHKSKTILLGLEDLKIN